MKTLDYISAIKKKHNVTSDYAVAKLIGITPQKMSGYATGDALPGTLNCMKIAEVLEVNPLQVLADIEIERAEKQGKEDVAREWSGVLERIGAALMTLLVGAVITGPTPSEASVHRGSASVVDTEYTS